MAAANFVGAAKGCKARIDAENAKGGVNGRKIDLESRSTTSRRRQPDRGQGPGARTRNVFAVVNDSPFAFLTYRYLVDAKVPMIGGGFDGSYYYDAGQRVHDLEPR